MTDNFEHLEGYMSDMGIPKSKSETLNYDKFFDIQLIRRGKDHKNLPSANYTFKTYYVDNIEYYKKLQEEVKTCCNTFGLRAYISVNIKSKEELLEKTLLEFANRNVNKDSRKPWRILSSVCGKMTGHTKRWIVDIDCDEPVSDKFPFELIVDYERIISQCDGKFVSKIVTTIPTRSGYHLITQPFNIKQFNDKCLENGLKIPNIKKNHLTLLYENIN